MTTTLDATVFRFTPHVGELKQLLELIGLRTELSSERGHYHELVGRRGRVHLHHSQGSGAELNLFTPRIADTAAALEAEGTPTRRWDESFGEQMRVPGPDSTEIDVCERQQDTYGYQLQDASGARGDVTAVWYTADVAADVAFFERYGFAPHGYGDDHWQAVASSETSGLIGVHRTDHGITASATSGQVELSFTTDEDLDALETRLKQAGHATTRYEDEFIAYCGVVDADGTTIQVHGSPQA